MELVVMYHRPLAFFTWWENFHDIFLYLTWYCRDRVSSYNIYAVQQDTQSFLMSEFIHDVC